MKRLVYYCRWQRVSLRLRGRDSHSVWGHLVTKDSDADRLESFRFDFRTGNLVLGEGADRRVLRLDEMGTVLED